jgi:hypothetical protein
VLYARRNDLDLLGIGAVETPQLERLRRRAGEDGVGAADHVALGPDSPLRLRIAGLGLHPGERVERGDQRQAEPVLQVVAGHA